MFVFSLDLNTYNLLQMISFVEPIPHYDLMNNLCACMKCLTPKSTLYTCLVLNLLLPLSHLFKVQSANVNRIKGDKQNLPGSKEKSDLCE